MSNYTRYPDPAGGIKIYPSVTDFPIDPGRDGVQAVAADTNTLYIYDTSVPGWQPIANPGAVVAITGLQADVSATGPGVVNATVNSVGGAAAADVATSVSDTQAATDLSTASTLMKRDASSKTALKGLKLDGATSGTLTIDPAAITTSYSVTMPAAQGAASTFLQNDGSGVLSWTTVDLSGLANRSLSNLTSPTALNQVLLGQNGTAAAPAYSFTSNSNLGFYRSAADTLAITCAGVQAATLTRNTLTYGDSGTSGHAVLNLRGGGNYGMIQKDGSIIMQFTSGRMEIASIPWYLITANSISTFGYQTASTNQNNTQSFYIGGLQKRLIVGPNRTTTLGNGGVVAAASRPYETLSSNITANDTNVLVVNTIGGTDESIRDRGRISMGIGEKIAITRTAQPTLIAKILSATVPNPGTWWIANYTLDITVPAAYTGGTVESRPTLFIASKADGSEAFSVDYQGSIDFDGGLTVKSTHAQTGTADAITVSVSDYYIGINSSGSAAGITVNLPAAATAGAGKQYVFKDENGSAATKNITIDPNGAELIDGAATYVMAVNRESVTILCDGTNWQII